MDRLTVRKAQPFDAGAMATLLNVIIARGGTTALRDPVTGDTLRDWMTASDIWHAAEHAGEILGFQWIGPHPKLPEDTCDIATFVDINKHGLGVGSKLFDATKRAAKDAGYRWINATIMAHNEAGLAYYGSRGFEEWARPEGRIAKRYRLTW